MRKNRKNNGSVAKPESSKGMSAARHRVALETLRRRIDGIDEDLVRLLDERSTAAMETARHKAALQEELYQPGREALVLRRVAGLRKIFPPESLASVYREIMSAALSLEHSFSVAVFGLEGTYTHEAAVGHFGRSARMRFEPTIPNVFLKVEKDEADVGVVPVENSTEGVIVHTLDTLVDSPLVIAGEIILPIRHNLMMKVPPGVKNPPKVTRILSHPQPLAQCREYLDEEFPNISREAAASTAAAAIAASKGKGVAAVASALAAERYGLTIIRRNIQDMADNTTRFLILRPASSGTPARTGEDKTSIVFSMKDKPGALFSMLEPFKKHSVNLTKIESRPSRVRSWRYVFFMDMEGHVSDARVASALAELESHCRFYRLLGSFPRP